MIAVLALLASPSFTWTSVEVGGGGFMPGIEFHPNEAGLAYARADIGGAYRWDEDRWTPLTDFLGPEDWNLTGIESIGLDPKDPDFLILAAGTYSNDWAGNGAMLVSTDRGHNFTRVDLPFQNGGNMPGRSVGERFAFDPSAPERILFGSRKNGLYESLDRGLTWQPVDSFPEIQSEDDFEGGEVGVGILHFDGSAIVAATDDVRQPILVSLDSGSTWTPLEGQPTGLKPHQMKRAADGSWWISYTDDGGPNDVTDGQVWRYDGAWTEVTPEVPAGDDRFGYAGLALHPTDPKRALVATLCRWAAGDTVFRTEDGGETWTSLRELSTMDAAEFAYLNWGRPAPDFGHWIGDVEIDPSDPGRALFVTGATIWETDDVWGDALVWTPEVRGIEETSVVDAVSPPIGAPVHSAMGDIGGFAHPMLDRSPASGFIMPRLHSQHDIDFAEAQPEIMIRSGYRGEVSQILISVDSGDNWVAMPHPDGLLRGTSALSADAKVVVWSPENGEPIRSDDRGLAWTYVEGLAQGALVISHRVDPSRFMAYDPSAGTWSVSEDSGRTFEVVLEGLPLGGRRPFAHYEGGLSWVPTPDGLVRITDFGAMTMQSGVGGARSVSTGPPVVLGDLFSLYVVGEVEGVWGLFRRVGGEWQEMTDERHRFGTMAVVVADRQTPGRVFVGANGRGLLAVSPK